MTVLAGDLRTVAREAYVYLYPLVMMEITRRQAGNVPAGERPGFGPPNRFHHMREFPAADFRTVVRPNFDTLYSPAWIDLTGGPVRIDVPDSGDRYYMLPMLDMWTDVFANPGKRTTGTRPQRFVLVPPGHRGGTPPGTTRIDAPTPHVWIIGRTQTNGPDDYPAVHKFQDGLEIVELGRPVEQAIDPSVDTTTEPLHLVDALSAAGFLTLGGELLRRHPPHHSDWDQLARLAPLGVTDAGGFRADAFTPAEHDEIEAGVAEGRTLVGGALPRLGAPVNGWVSFTDTMGVYGNSYLKRAAITLGGLGANPAEDAIYPLLLADADGDPLTGEVDHVIHFAADALPPATAFWSVTMYDAEGFQVANELDRFAIGDRDPLTFNRDGSLDIHVRHTNPGPELVSNWLPAPTGPLGITMRLYAPQPAALDGTWNPPPVTKAR